MHLARLLNRGWSVLDAVLRKGGLAVSFGLLEAAMNWRLPELAVYTLEILSLIALFPSTHHDLTNAPLSDGRQGVALVLRAASGGAHEDPVAMKAALEVLCCVAAPPLLHCETGEAFVEERRWVLESIRANNGLKVRFGWVYSIATATVK